ncbi:MAG: PQQ-dependent sugar dehydrogenase, partial [Solirubrobacterales bacterium]|nr:PQQ-dependent sugar dehydrogenase [Solirubrobacterales bacterium]
MNGRLLAATLVWLLAITVPAAAQLVPIDSFKQPVHATTAPGDYHRLYVVEKAGVIRAHHFDHTHGDAFLDLSAQVLNEREAGMFSMAFPPDHRASGKFYVAYADRGGDVRVQEVSARGPDEADPASRRDVLTVEHSATKIHFGGQLQFRDGFLWLSLGDASVRANGQNDATRLGKLLRIDPATGAVETFGKGL